MLPIVCVRRALSILIKKSCVKILKKLTAVNNKEIQLEKLNIMQSCSLKNALTVSCIPIILNIVNNQSYHLESLCIKK
jgi:hypothetical protein